MKHLKITSVLLSAAICVSFVMTPVGVFADEIDAPAETTAATEAPETKETEEAKETTKAAEPSEETETSKETEATKETESSESSAAPSEESAPETTGETVPSESVPETPYTEPSVQNKENEEPSESTEPSESSPEEPEETVPSEPGTEEQDASRKEADKVITGNLTNSISYSFNDLDGVLTLSGTGKTLSYKSDSPFGSIRDKVKEVVVNDGIEFIGARLFKGFKKLERASIADSVTGIDSRAFENCTSMKAVKLPSKLDIISSEVFLGCTSLETITIPGSTSSVLSDAFKGCTGLHTVTVMEGVKNIDNWFKGCDSIKYLNLPKSLVSMKGTFDGCTQIYRVKYPGSKEDWNKIDFGPNGYPFTDYCVKCQLDTYKITVKPVHGKVTLTQYEGYEGERSYYQTIPDPGYYFKGYREEGDGGYRRSQFLVFENRDIVYEFVFLEIAPQTVGHQFDSFPLRYAVTNPAIDGTGTVKCIGLVSLVSTTDPSYGYGTYRITIPDTVTCEGVVYKVTSVDANAFKGNNYINTVTLGSNIAVIGNNAFYGCPYLTKVSGGAKLKTIGSNAFARCPKLLTFVITSKVLYKIGTYAFNKDSKLKTIYIKNTTKLTKKGVKKSLKGSSVKKVKVKKSKVKKYKKYFTKKNCGRKVKVKK